MSIKHITINYSNRLFFCLLFLLLSGCASIQQPQGGPRDTTAPKVLSMVPENLTTNFNAEKIIIQFDEYFNIKEEFKEFSISPELPTSPVLKKKGKRLEITFPDSLERNTTYTLNFGKAIADVNESNVVKNLSYVFATGPQLDSLSIKGKITNSVTGLPEIDALAFILPMNRDTLFGKGKPAIYTLTDSTGNYRLNNLRKDTYRLYALKEKSGDKIYQQNTDEIGFYPDSINLTGNREGMDMKIFKEDASVFRILDRKLNKDGSITFAFNQKLKNPEVTVTDPPTIDATKRMRFSKNNDSLRIWLKDLSFDSTKISIKSDGKLLQTVNFTRGKKETYTRELTSTDNLEAGSLNPNKILRFTFNFPVEDENIDKITLLEDSVELTNFTLRRDSIDFLTYYIEYPWKPKKQYDLKFGAGAFTGIFNTKNKEFSKKFQLFGKDEYGTLKVKIETPEPDKSYILEIVDENKNMVNKLVVRKDTSEVFNNYKAGKYFIRITYDTNKNGVWDTGNVTRKEQPERVWNEPKELSIRALWERNETISIPKE